MEEYPFLKLEKSPQKQKLKDPVHIKLYDILSYEPLSGDDIAYKMEKTIGELLPHISLLEMKHILRKNRQGKYEIV